MPLRSAKMKILDASLDVIREKGYAATSVDDLCQAAGVTKGAFFHHFASKDEMAVASAQHWTDVTAPLFAAAPYHLPEDAAERVLAYVAFRKALLSGQSIAGFACLAGTMIQETFHSHPDIRAACGASITSHAQTLEADIAAALAEANEAGISAKSLALFTQSTLQGAFILAKATDDPASAEACCDHLTRYLQLLFKTTRTV